MPSKGFKGGKSSSGISSTENFGPVRQRVATFEVCEGTVEVGREVRSEPKMVSKETAAQSGASPTPNVGFGSGNAPPPWHSNAPEYQRQQEEYLQGVYGKNPKTGRHYTDRPAKK